MRSRTAIRGNFLASCIPEGASDGKSAPPWQHIAAVHPKRAGVGKICAPCIRKAPQTAVRGCITRISCQEGALFAALTPRIMHTAQILPSVAAEQRERSQARRRPYGAAACLGTAEQGAGSSLLGGVALPKERVALWGAERYRQSRHQRSSACGSPAPATSPNLESWHSRGGFRAGRRQGGAYQAAPPSGGCSLPVQKVVSAPHRLCRQLLRRAVRALGAPASRSMKKLARWYFLH